MKRLLVLLIALTALMALPQSANAQAQWTWKTVNSGTPNQLNSVIWTGSQFVVVGAGGTVLTSPDAINWTSQSSGNTNGLNSVIWTGSQFVAVGGGGTVLTSPDGVNWTSQNSGTTGDLYSVTWTGSKLVAVGYGGFWSAYGDTYIALTSPDGISWTKTSPSTPPFYFLGFFSSVIWTGSQIVASVSYGYKMCGDCRGSIATSSDGIGWTERKVGDVPLTSVTWTGTQFVAVGNGYIYGCSLLIGIFTSPDGITWTSQKSGTTQSLWSITHSSNQHVVVGGNGTILSSPDGIIWRFDSSKTTCSLYSVTPGNAQIRFVAVGANGTIIIYSLSSGTSVKTTPNSPAVESLLHAKARNSLLTISLPSSMLGRAVDFAVYSASGREIVRKSILRAADRFTMSVPNLAVGAYVLSVKDGFQKKAVRFVVAR